MVMFSTFFLLKECTENLCLGIRIAIKVFLVSQRMHQGNRDEEGFSTQVCSFFPLTDEIVVIVLLAVVCCEVMLLHHAITQQPCKSLMCFPLAVM